MRVIRTVDLETVNEGIARVAFVLVVHFDFVGIKLGVRPGIIMQQAGLQLVFSRRNVEAHFAHARGFIVGGNGEGFDFFTVQRERHQLGIAPAANQSANDVVAFHWELMLAG